MLSQDSVNFLVKNLTSKIEKVNLSGLEIMDEHIELLLKKCNQIKVTFMCPSAELSLAKAQGQSFHFSCFEFGSKMRTISKVSSLSAQRCN